MTNSSGDDDVEDHDLDRPDAPGSRLLALLGAGAPRSRAPRAAAARLLQASRRRLVLDCLEPDGGRGDLDAAAVREACLAAARDGDPFGIRIANATVVGELDLRAVQVPVPLHFLGCVFEQAPRFEGAQVHELLITARGYAAEIPDGVLGTSELPGLLGNGLVVRRNLSLSGTRVTGSHASTASLTRTAAVWLAEASVGGRLLCAGTRFETDADRALHADRIVISGDVRLVKGFRADAEVRLLAARIGGSLDLTGATVVSRSGRALDVTEARIGGSVFLIDDPVEGVRPTVDGRIDLGRATVHGRIMVRNATCGAPREVAGALGYTSADVARRVFLQGQGLEVHGELSFSAGTTVDGALVLPGAVLRGGAVLDGVVVTNPGDVALDLGQAQLGSWLSLQRARVRGTVNLSSIQVAGPVSLRRTEFVDPRDGRCLVAISAGVTGDVLLTGAVAAGAVNLRSSRITGNVHARDMVVENPGGRSLSLRQAQVQGNVQLTGGFRSVGALMLARAVIGGTLDVKGAHMAWLGVDGAPAGPTDDNPRACAVEAVSATVGGGITLGWRIGAGAVDLTDVKTTYLADDPAHDWPRRSHVSGFVYERYAPVDRFDGQGEWDPRARAAWLRGLEPYDPRAWERAAAVLKANGDGTGAEHLLIDHRRWCRSSRVGGQARAWRRAVDRLEDLVIGYGYRPHRTLFVMVALIVAVQATLAPFAWGPAMRTQDAAGVVYSPSGVVAEAEAGTTAGTGTGTTAGTGTTTGAGGAVDVAAGSGCGPVRCFDPLLYAVDTVVPIVDLKQRSTWYPDGATPWLGRWLDLATVLGWAATTVFALAFARLGRAS